METFPRRRGDSGFCWVPNPVPIRVPKIFQDASKLISKKISKNGPRTVPKLSKNLPRISLYACCDHLPGNDALAPSVSRLRGANSCCGAGCWELEPWHWRFQKLLQTKGPLPFQKLVQKKDFQLLKNASNAKFQRAA